MIYFVQKNSFKKPFEPRYINEYLISDFKARIVCGISWFIHKATQSVKSTSNYSQTWKSDLSTAILNHCCSIFQTDTF